MIKKIFFNTFLLLQALQSLSQTTSIGLQKHELGTSDGYTLFTPARNNNVYLINNCGEKINEWTFNEQPGATCYLLENGNLLRAGKDNLEIRDWNNNLLWTYPTTANGISQHHDIEPLPNGNILCIANDAYTNLEISNEGRDPSITAAQFRLDKIIELQPVGTNNANIVWEWKFFDHLIQDFDNTKQNYGVVENHPELIDINFNNGFDNDWTHVNGIDYNSNLDQIIISTRHLSEIYIIDHSTTLSEASGHTGGNFNKGGDILWRWGNPQVYRQGTSLDQKLFLQHDSKWVESGYLDEGKISVFNNGGDGSFVYSSVHLIVPEIIGNQYTLSNNKFNPQNFDWSWNGSFFGEIMLENKKSGAHSLPNGNFIICETSKGRISEITKSGTHLWSYINPSGQTIFNQNDVVTSFDVEIFRGEKYPTNYIGFNNGQSLTPNGIIENSNIVSNNCITTLTSDNFNIEDDQFTIITPSKNKLIEFNKAIDCQEIYIFDTTGKLKFKTEKFSGKQLNVTLNKGLYLIKFIFKDKIEARKTFIE